MTEKISMSAFRVMVVFLSFLCTPWLLFLSTSLPLYAKNQEDLFNFLPVIYPFVYATLLTALFGMTVFYLHRVYKNLGFLKFVVIAYYFLGIVVILTSTVNATNLSAYIKFFTVLAILTTGASVIYFIRNKVTMDVLVNSFAILSLIFITADVVKYLSIVVNHSVPQFSSELNVEKNTNKGNRDVELPNIYHLMFDEFQTEMFTVNLNDNLRKKLSGFTFYSDTTTVYGRTGMSIPSVFLGRAYDMNSPQVDYKKAAFNEGTSLLSQLKQAGYTTNAYLHGVFKFRKALFDKIILHKELSDYNTGFLSDSFIMLWIYSLFPSQVSNFLIGADQVEQFALQNQLDHNSHIMSYRSFRYMLDQESLLSSRNRYTYSHLLIPHFPYVFSPECEYLGKEKGASPKDQASCGIKLILDLIDELKLLGRYKESLIVIQSDHGARFKLDKNNLVDLKSKGYFSVEWSRARSRSLLLIKPVGQGTEEKLRISNRPAQLTDIAPTILADLGFTKPANMTGENLLMEPDENQPRVRDYYFYAKKGKRGWTDEMAHYEIEGNRITNMGLKKLNNNEKQ
jgi:hypothetical protein